MTTDEVAKAIVAWARATIPELVTGYSWDTGFKTGGLPDVLVEVTDKSVTAEATDFPYLDLQQGFLRRFDIEASFMADVADLDSTESHKAAAEQLRSFDERLEAAKLSDGTLGDRVEFVSIFHRFQYRPGFVRFEDGLQGRELRLLMAVGEIITVDG